MQLKEKGILAFTFSSVYLSSMVSNAFAAVNTAPINLAPTAPKQGYGIPANDQTVRNIINNAVALVYTLAVIAVIIYLIWGAFNWITSGGDKAKIEAAQKMITNALIGLAILAFVFVIVYIVARILKIDITQLNIGPLDNNTGA